MSNKVVSDKPLVIKMIIACVVAILIFTFAWAKHFFHNLDNWLFALVEGGLIAFFIVESIGAYRYSEEPNKDWKRVLVILIAVALCAWSGGWAAGSNGKKMYNDDVERAKQTSMIHTEEIQYVDAISIWAVGPYVQHQKYWYYINRPIYHHAPCFGDLQPGFGLLLTGNH